MKFNRTILVLMAAIFSLVVFGCQPATTDLNSVELAVGYIPNVQFAPFYVAMDQGYYAKEGIDIQLIYGYEIDGVSLVGANEYQFTVASGEQILLAHDKNLPVVYVMNWYDQFPVGITVLADSNIATLNDLKGHSIGTPALQGASYIAMEALLDSAGIAEDEVTINVIGYSQVEMLSTKRVDAVVVYLANEPVQLESQGYAVRSFAVSDYVDLVGNGLVTNKTTLENDPELVRKMIRATLQGVQYAVDHPEDAYRICRNYVENLPEEIVDNQQYEVLLNSIAFWTTDSSGLSSPQAWKNTATLLENLKMISPPGNLDELYTNEYLP